MSTSIPNVFLFIVAAILPPVVSGPVAATVFVAILKEDTGRRLLLFWLMLIAWDVATFFFIANTTGDFIGPGFVACLATPIAVAFALIIRRSSSHRFYQAIGDDKVRQRWFLVGTLLIPFLQIVTVILLVLLRPALCEMGIISCEKW